MGMTRAATSQSGVSFWYSADRGREGAAGGGLSEPTTGRSDVWGKALRWEQPGALRKQEG